MDWALVQTKIPNLNLKFNLANREERKRYFELKAGEEIRKIKEYLKDNTFIAYLMAIKLAGKSTYTKMLMEIFGEDSFAHVSVGDVIRDFQQNYKANQKEFDQYLTTYYRGYIPLDEAIATILDVQMSKPYPTEIILTLVKRKIDQIGRKALFVDGFPRNFDQISYSLYFRELINYRDDPDFFVFINIPDSVVDMRIKYRVVCPKCQRSYNTKLLSTKEVGYDEEKDKFFLKCDNPECKLEPMVQKQGDDKGISLIADRIKTDKELITKAKGLHGVKIINLHNAIPAQDALNYVDDYEITPEYIYQFNPKNKKVTTKTKPLTFKDNKGVESYSLLPAPVAVSYLKQLVKVLEL